MFFPRLRRQAKWVFVFLALVFGLGFVVFGVGTGGGLGLGDILSGGGTSVSGPSVGDAQERIRENPNNAAAYRDLAEALQNRGRFEEAIPPLERYVRMRPRDRDALKQLGSLYDERLRTLQERYSVAQFKSERERFGQVVAPPLQTGANQTLPQDPITAALTSRTDEEINAVSTELQEVGRKATGTYGRLARLEPSDPSVQIQWALAAETAGDYPTALRAFKRFLKLAPDDPTAPAVEQRVKQIERFTSATRGG